MKEPSKCYTWYGMCYCDYTHTKHHLNDQRCHVMSCPISNGIFEHIRGFDITIVTSTKKKKGPLGLASPIAHEAYTHLLAHPFSKVTLP